MTDLSPEATAFLAKNKAARFPGAVTAWKVRLFRRLYARQGAKSVRRALDARAPHLTRDRVAKVPVVSLDPVPAGSAPDSDYLVYIHGGAFVVGSAVDELAIELSAATGLPAYSIDYDLSPEVRYPRALHQCHDVWQALTSERPGRPVLVGASAGGNLALALLLLLLKESGTLPAAAVLVTPWTDLSATGESRARNEGKDPIIRWHGQLDKAAAVYADQASLADPLVSPVHGDWHGLAAPTLITTGTLDLFESDCTRLHESMQAHGVPVTIDVADGLWHGYQAEADLPEARRSIEAIGRFIGDALT